MSHPTNVTLDNVLVEGIVAANVFTDSNTTVTIPVGSPGANFAIPAAQTIAVGDPTGIPCDWGWPVPHPQ